MDSKMRNRMAMEINITTNQNRQNDGFTNLSNQNYLHQRQHKRKMGIKDSSVGARFHPYHPKKRNTNPNKKLKNKKGIPKWKTKNIKLTVNYQA